MFFSFLVTCVLACLACTHAQSINLGQAGAYGIVAGTSIINTGASAVLGSIGVYPGTSVIGFPPGVYTGGKSAGNPVAASVQSDASNAYSQASALPCGTDLTGQDLGGMVLLPGVYCFATSASLTGILTLDGAGTTNPLFVFQVGTTLTTGTASVVQIEQGVSPCAIFWAVGSSVTLGTATEVSGNIIAQSLINARTDVTSMGGLYSLTGSVSLIQGNVQAEGSCDSAPVITTTTSTTSTTSTTTSTTTATTPTTTETTTTTSTTTTSTTTAKFTNTTSTTMLNCNADNCLRAFRATQTPGRLSNAQAYCATYTETTSHSSTPTWVPAECTAARISSVCTCIAPPTTPTPTTTSTPAPPIGPTTGPS